MKTRTLRQSVVFKATPHEVYEALMDSRTHGRFTGGPARISRKVGGRFSAFGGWAAGTNLVLVPDRKIVQAWWCQTSGWPKDHYSRATFTLRRFRGGTRLSFRQSGVPAAAYADIRQGWWDSYWTPMKALLEG
ncbi:MAG TPA: SRPBCC family protein [bacterium]|jgi:activator of HSP90 ATPase|nr:SRPBCC family protein [bacterium]